MKWISVKDRLPEIDKYVLWIHENGLIFMECIDKDFDGEYLEYFLNGCGRKETSGIITHWMTLPKPPKESNK